MGERCCCPNFATRSGRGGTMGRATGWPAIGRFGCGGRGAPGTKPAGRGGGPIGTPGRTEGALPGMDAGGGAPGEAPAGRGAVDGMLGGIGCRGPERIWPGRGAPVGIGRAGGGTGRPGVAEGCCGAETGGAGGLAGPAGRTGAGRGRPGSAEPGIGAPGTAAGAETGAGGVTALFSCGGRTGGATGATGGRADATGTPRGNADGRGPMGGWIGLPLPSSGGRNGIARGL
jgi:hypothetical protein